MGFLEYLVNYLTNNSSNKGEEKVDFKTWEIPEQRVPHFPKLQVDGTLLKHMLFESLWIQSNIDGAYGIYKNLSDNDYIDYHLWEVLNEERLWGEHDADRLVIRDIHPNIIFHGGCLGCVSQSQHGVDRCKGCQYFKPNWNLPDLKIEGEQPDSIPKEELLEDIIKKARKRN
jgi:hypothetical protein